MGMRVCVIWLHSSCEAAWDQSGVSETNELWVVNSSEGRLLKDVFWFSDLFKGFESWYMVIRLIWWSIRLPFLRKVWAKMIEWIALKTVFFLPAESDGCFLRSRIWSTQENYRTHEPFRVGNYHIMICSISFISNLPHGYGNGINAFKIGLLEFFLESKEDHCGLWRSFFDPPVICQGIRSRTGDSSSLDQLI